MINQIIMVTSEYILTHHSLNFYAKYLQPCKFMESEFLNVPLLSVTVLQPSSAKETKRLPQVSLSNLIVG